MSAAFCVSIDLPLHAHSLSEKTTKSKCLPPHTYCCRANKLADTTTGLRRTDAGVHTHAKNMKILPNHNGGGRRREKVKRFVAEKGPRIAGAAAAIGMFIFNVVASCA